MKKILSKNITVHIKVKRSIILLSFYEKKNFLGIPYWNKMYNRHYVINVDFSPIFHACEINPMVSSGNNDENYENYLPNTLDLDKRINEIFDEIKTKKALDAAAIKEVDSISQLI